jgi:fumarylacetoacetate (FAA) hydrolase
VKLATRKNGTRDGELLVVSRDNQRAAVVGAIAPTLQSLMDDWAAKVPAIETMFDALNAGTHPDAFEVDTTTLHSPLPRAYAWIDGSAYINHIVLVRKARGAEPPATLRTDPLVYQGGSDTFIGPRDDIPLADPAWGCDFESEIAVVMDDTPQGVKPEDVSKYIRLVMLCNDVSLRNLIPGELAKSFGFFNSKPSSAFSPLAVTPDELGEAWKGGRIHLPLVTHLNGEWYGNPDAGPEMFFGFFEIVAHVCKTRSLGAGTIIGSGTVSNEDRSRGSSCLAERRMIEKIETGEFTTPFMSHGDSVTIEMFSADGKSIFGRIEQTVAPMS